MEFQFVHANINVTDMEKSLAFYKQALGLGEVRRREADDGSYLIVFLNDGVTNFQLELTWLRDHEGPYELGDNESHLAFVVEDFAGAHERHEAMGCICFENPKIGIYFIHDPDDYWIEILPKNRG